VNPAEVQSTREPYTSPARQAKDGDAKPQPHKAPFMCTDLGNGERLVAAHGDRIRYCAAWKKWLCWDGKRWKRDERERVYHLAKLTVRAIYGEAERCADKKERVALAKWAQKSEARERVAAMVACAQSEPAITIHPDDLDADPWLLNVANGTIDLRTGMLRPHRREDKLTKLAPVVFDLSAKAPTWENFLAEVLPDAEVRTFVQRFAGYCLTGDVSERIFVFAHGTGKNGKSVALRVLRSVLGEYATVAAPDLLIAKRWDKHPTEIADLFGMRLVVCSEVKIGSAFDEQRIKEFTGNDGAIKARYMGKDFWAFAPTFKLAVAANHEPRVLDETDSIWDRLRKIPFTVRIADDKIDKHLFEKRLRAELPGVLAWCVQGCLDWKQHGLGAPAAVCAATTAYREGEDVVGRFLSDCCVFEAEGRATTKALTDAAKQWAEANSEREIPRKAITDRLKASGCTEKRTNRARGWKGVRQLRLDEAKARDGDGVTDGDTENYPPGPFAPRDRPYEETASPAVTRHLPGLS
jgi:putative DNA primase/helicase